MQNMPSFAHNTHKLVQDRMGGGGMSFGLKLATLKEKKGGWDTPFVA